MMPVSGLRLDPPVPVPDHVVVEHVDEPVHRDAREAALVEELLLAPAEEPFRGRVVRTASLRARRTRQTMLLADANPFRPPVVQPRSEWMIGFSPSLSVEHASASMPLANAESGLVPIVQATGMPS